MHRDLQNIGCFFAHTGQDVFRPRANFAERQRCNMYPTSPVRLPTLIDAHIRLAGRGPVTPHLA